MGPLLLHFNRNKRNLRPASIARLGLDYKSVSAMRVQSTAHWLALFEQIDVPAVPLNTIESLLDDPHLAAAGFLLPGRAPE